ncbi:MAG: BMC domain-containing protein [Spirochaetaceae bacterium]|nr:MAG: BMC domain-containing protein [Spirochaetaceae bacterium]
MRSSIHVLGTVELDSVAQGYRVLDLMVKAAPISVLRATVINPGKFLIMVTGDVAAVEEAIKRGISAAGECLLDYLFLPNLHTDVIPALRARDPASFGERTEQVSPAVELDALGLIEAFSTTAGIEAADAAAKEAAVRVLEIRLGDELGGKSTATVTGPIGEVEAALAVAEGLLRRKQLLVRTTVIPRPHGDLAPFVAGIEVTG